jgi:hypothetical protein
LFHEKRNAAYQAEKFQSYNDWFYFIHVDPFIRFWHALGMCLGFCFYFKTFYLFMNKGLVLSLLPHFLIGVFFFYFLPLISHYYYDRGSAKSTPDRFHSTLIPVIHINLMTLTGQYDKWLRKFVEKYPFTTDAWQLEEREFPFLR